jgi:glycosyltransferase involved in cell wall biosynthesis
LSYKDQVSGVSLKSLWIVTNIPTPYRIYFFQHLYGALKKRGIAFHVSFMAITEKGRNWKYENGDDLGFPYTFHKGFHPRIWNVPFHFNPGIAMRAALGRDDICIVAGGWLMPSAVAVPVNRGSRSTFFWSESNMDSLRRTGRSSSMARRLVLSRFNGFCVPNDRALQWLRAYVPGLKGKKIIPLPNLVDESLYIDGKRGRQGQRSTLRKQYNVREADRVLVCPARLMVRKGIPAFLEAVRDLPVSGITLLVAGDGPDRKDFENLAASVSHIDVRFLGFCDIEAMLDLYALSDAFLLPSFEDPNPLSVIEACHSGLPLLLSRRLGNLPETLAEGANGWSFDPGDVASVRSAVTALANTPISVLEQMGRESAAIGEKNFGTASAVDWLIHSLEAIEV